MDSGRAFQILASNVLRDRRDVRHNIFHTNGGRGGIWKHRSYSRSDRHSRNSNCSSRPHWLLRASSVPQPCQEENPAV